MVKNRKRKRNKRLVALSMVVFFSLWTLFVLYPNPYHLFASVYRMFRPAVDAAAVAELMERAPGDPEEIERFVLKTIPYEYNWQTFGMPFYFPTTQEAMTVGAGDCKVRFIVLASLFEAMEIPYQQTFSLSHFWVSYEGKTQSGIEQDQNAFLTRTEEGIRLQIPKENIKDSLNVLWEGFWVYMPLHRKILFLMGFPLSILVGVLTNRRIVKKVKIKTENSELGEAISV
ncbi:hypothetical protein Amet_0778 [Alkaliphilus metalliredigens QYMF]|uniref:Transglutaminase-like domain-containing protein n=1 Tax=Alkaliphilus metalliredigens (strain QYMF) TaxID=293826 RepID=A6TLD5_ALKMQ|nr:hypothetical protein [Alkaliphilus metalliredigens]ABR47003.1 hypothetical protein Amet_0778 [Alkaliphilus metalliredigens QYMF]